MILQCEKFALGHHWAKCQQCSEGLQVGKIKGAAAITDAPNKPKSAAFSLPNLLSLGSILEDEWSSTVSRLYFL